MDGISQAIANISWAQWLGVFLLIPTAIVVFGVFYETLLKIYWKHRIQGENAIAQGKLSVQMAADKIKRDELAKENK